MELFVFLLALCQLTCADIFMKNPRGSNNRLNEETVQRVNANRLFDSQNNDRGGHNVGDKYDVPSETMENQYQMKYFQSSAKEDGGESHLKLEWTMQHGCGDEENSKSRRLNCDVVIQMMCQDVAIESKLWKIRDGQSRNTNAFRKGMPKNHAGYSKRVQKSVVEKRGMHEPLYFYDNCFTRSRNQNLFTADQEVKERAIHTRQNADGTRRGYECPEEKDYYPYWHTSPWKDIAVLTDESRCSYYEKESFNVAPKYECVEYWFKRINKKEKELVRKPFSQYNNEDDCTANNGKWTALYNFLEKIPEASSKELCEKYENSMWEVPYDTKKGTEECLIKLAPPDCRKAPLTRENHNGNAYGKDDDEGLASNYNWTIPHFPSLKDQRCVLRIRYNISTGDFSRDVDASSNNVISNNPDYVMGASHSNGKKMPNLKLAINTAQFGRTFQDRSHVFILKQRPEGLDGDIHNLNVRGKRGNIQQTYLGVEYDFFPTDLKITSKDLIHIQWTGSNSNNPQAAGQGDAGTDRNNIVEISSRDKNIPLSLKQSTMYKNAKIMWSADDNTKTPDDLAISLATAGYTSCGECSGEGDLDELDDEMNSAPASYEGVVIKFNPGEYHYMCTRNNQFTNRNQKGSIYVKEA